MIIKSSEWWPVGRAGFLRREQRGGGGGEAGLGHWRYSSFDLGGSGPDIHFIIILHTVCVFCTPLYIYQTIKEKKKHRPTRRYLPAL